MESVGSGSEYKIVRQGRCAWALYHLAEDRTETKNLAPKHPDRVTQMAAIWENRWANKKKSPQS